MGRDIWRFCTCDGNLGPNTPSQHHPQHQGGELSLEEKKESGYIVPENKQGGYEQLIINTSGEFSSAEIGENWSAVDKVKGGEGSETDITFDTKSYSSTGFGLNSVVNSIYDGFQYNIDPQRILGKQMRFGIYWNNTMNFQERNCGDLMLNVYINHELFLTIDNEMQSPNQKNCKEEYQTKIDDNWANMLINTLVEFNVDYTYIQNTDYQYSCWLTFSIE